jgi:pSer/pThr/pTyr-binding forkhead associated (FHA) protein
VPKLTLKSETTVIESISLAKDKTLTIGEASDNDLVIDDPAVSGHHAEIEADGDLFYITDRQSRNGTFINEELIISRILSEGDVITVGNHTLEFNYEEGEEIPSDTDIMSARMTMVLDTQEHRSKLAQNVSKLAQSGLKKETQAILSYMDGSNRIFPLTTSPVKIGKSSENHIQVKGLFLAKTIATINRTGKEFRLAPSEGTSRLKVNYQPVKTEIVLKEFDVIEIGSAQFQFCFQKVDTPVGNPS